MEKNVQMLCDSDFIVKLHETYNETESLFLLLELALGGELYATYNKKQFFGRENFALFYVADTSMIRFPKTSMQQETWYTNMIQNKSQKMTNSGNSKTLVSFTYYSLCMYLDFSKIVPHVLEFFIHIDVPTAWSRSGPVM